MVHSKYYPLSKPYVFGVSLFALILSMSIFMLIYSIENVNLIDTLLFSIICIFFLFQLIMFINTKIVFTDKSLIVWNKTFYPYINQKKKIEVLYSDIKSYDLVYNPIQVLTIQTKLKNIKYSIYLKQFSKHQIELIIRELNLMCDIK